MKNTAEIVQARPEDAAELIEYIRQIGAETDNLSFGAEGLPFDVASEADYLRSQMDSADSVSYLARIDGRIVGDAGIERLPRRMGHRGDLGISVLKSEWGKGIGSMLMEKIIRFAAENDFDMIDLEVRSDNARAISLYERYGFRKICRYPAFFKIDGRYIDFDLMNLWVGKDPLSQ